jgi:hypothetical protein
LAQELQCNEFTLYKPGWLPRLLQNDIVGNDQLIGGYFLPAFPPVDAI